MTVTTVDFQVHHWEVIDILNDKGVQPSSPSPEDETELRTSVNVTIEQHVELALEALYRRLPWFEVESLDHVLIEVQKSGQFGNATMKTLSHTIQGFFVLLGMTGGYPAVPVSLVSPTLKLHVETATTARKKAAELARVAALDHAQAAAEAEVEATEDVTKRRRKKYKKNKSHGVDAVRDLVAQNADAAARFETFPAKKRDDPADAFLQGYAWVHKTFKEAAKTAAREARAAAAAAKREAKEQRKVAREDARKRKAEDAQHKEDARKRRLNA